MQYLSSFLRPVTKNRSAHSYISAAKLNGMLKIIGHSHGKPNFFAVQPQFLTNIIPAFPQTYKVWIGASGKIVPKLSNGHKPI